MKLLASLCALWRGGLSDAEVTLDHLPVAADSEEWRDKALKRAAKKFGKPFKAGAKGIPHEVVRSPAILKLEAEQQKAQPANVRPIKRKVAAK